MALITVCGAKGAPGVTTTAALLAGLWARETVLVDADPAGGDLALRLTDAQRRPLHRDRGLLSLLPAARRGLVPATVLDHVQHALGGQPVLAGLASPEQALAVGGLWDTLAEGFRGLEDHDVVVDAGQVHARSSHLALVEAADAVLWVCRPTAWSVVHTRRSLESLAGHFAGSATRVGLVCVAGSRAGQDAAAAMTAIRGDWPWLADLGVVALDPRAVAMFEGGEVFRPERTLLARSGRTLAARLEAELEPTHAGVVERV